ncbi:MAG: hypothetical protein DRP46_03580 [Candidatus Zixiibacteriota bacterium]|nr:MAG: hypothetical protein DRP46_03580 [candidate division Zixibacteria bacterium]
MNTFTNCQAGTGKNRPPETLKSNPNDSPKTDPKSDPAGQQHISNPNRRTQSEDPKKPPDKAEFVNLFTKPGNRHG